MIKLDMHLASIFAFLPCSDSSRFRLMKLKGVVGKSLNKKTSKELTGYDRKEPDHIIEE